MHRVLLNSGWQSNYEEKSSKSSVTNDRSSNLKKPDTEDYNQRFKKKNSYSSRGNRNSAAGSREKYEKK